MIFEHKKHVACRNVFVRRSERTKIQGFSRVDYRTKYVHPVAGGVLLNEEISKAKSRLATTQRAEGPTKKQNLRSLLEGNDEAQRSSSESKAMQIAVFRRAKPKATRRMSAKKNEIFCRK